MGIWGTGAHTGTGTAALWGKLESLKHMVLMFRSLKQHLSLGHKFYNQLDQDLAVGGSARHFLDNNGKP